MTKEDWYKLDVGDILNRENYYLWRVVLVMGGPFHLVHLQGSVSEGIQKWVWHQNEEGPVCLEASGDFATEVVLLEANRVRREPASVENIARQLANAGKISEEDRARLMESSKFYEEQAMDMMAGHGL